MDIRQKRCVKMYIILEWGLFIPNHIYNMGKGINTVVLRIIVSDPKLLKIYCTVDFKRIFRFYTEKSHT